MATSSGMDARPSHDLDDAAGYAPLHCTWLRYRNVLWIQPIDWAQDSPRVSYCVGFQSEQDRGCYHRPASRSAPSPHAGDVFLAVPPRHVGPVSSDSAAGRISARCPVGLHGMDDISDRWPADPGWLALLRGSSRAAGLLRFAGGSDSFPGRSRTQPSGEVNRLLPNRFRPYFRAMNFKLIPFAAAASLFLVPLVADGKTLKFPKEKPQFSIAFPNDWKAEITDAGIISA